MDCKYLWAGLALAATAALASAPYRAAEGEPIRPRLASADDACRQGPARVIGRIRYDSGLELHYCGLPAMFEQLVAMEQPGLIRAASVRMDDGRWQDVRRLRYRRDAAAWRVYHEAAPAGAAASTYQQLLQACAQRSCGNG